jgi:hypothetical protein
MLVKGLVLTVLVASTPIALVSTQDPRPQPARPADAGASSQQRLEALQRQTAHDLERTQQELNAARADVERLRRQLDGALDALDRTFEPQRERSCSPSRSRILMSHWQWLRDQGHEQRATGALAKVVDQVGNDQGRRNSVAWDLMTDKESAGKFDEVALAIAQRMESTGASEHHHLDTIALANFLNGKVDRAVELQQQAIAAGGSGDDYRRRLRTYEVARDTIAKGQAAKPAAGPTLIAATNDD